MWTLPLLLLLPTLASGLCRDADGAPLAEHQISADGRQLCTGAGTLEIQAADKSSKRQVFVHRVRRAASYPDEAATDPPQVADAARGKVGDAYLDTDFCQSGGPYNNITQAMKEYNKRFLNDGDRDCVMNCSCVDSPKERLEGLHQNLSREIIVEQRRGSEVVAVLACAVDCLPPGSTPAPDGSTSPTTPATTQSSSSPASTSTTTEDDDRSTASTVTEGSSTSSTSTTSTSTLTPVDGLEECEEKNRELIDFATKVVGDGTVSAPRVVDFSCPTNATLRGKERMWLDASLMLGGEGRGLPTEVERMHMRDIICAGLCDKYYEITDYIGKEKREEKQDKIFTDWIVMNKLSLPSGGLKKKCPEKEDDVPPFLLSGDAHNHRAPPSGEKRLGPETKSILRTIVDGLLSYAR